MKANSVTASDTEREWGSVPAYAWMRPAWLVGYLRAGLRHATAGDAQRLRQLPAAVGALLLPAIAVAIPLVISILHATTAPNVQPAPQAATVVIGDVFTESIPFMAAALVIGIASPAAGALLVAVFAIGNLVVTIMSGELEPPLGALFGRLVSYWVLWLLAVEVPLLGRSIAEQQLAVPTQTRVRWLSSIVLGTAVTVALAFAWVQAAPLLITVVYWTTAAWGAPFLAAAQPLQLYGWSLVAVAAAASFPLLALRYGGDRPHVGERSTVSMRLPGAQIVAMLVPALVGLILLSAVISQPIDAAILFVTLLVAPVLARAALSATHLAGPMTRIPRSIRLILGFVAGAIVDWAFFTLVPTGDEPTRWFSTVIAIALAFVVIVFFLSPEDVVGRGTSGGGRGVRTELTRILLLMVVVAVAVPARAFADNCGDRADCWSDAFAAALATSAAAAAVALAAITWGTPGTLSKDVQRTGDAFRRWWSAVRGMPPPAPDVPAPPPPPKEPEYHDE